MNVVLNNFSRFSKVLVDNRLKLVQIVECNALPSLILMLRSEDPGIHYEAV